MRGIGGERVDGRRERKGSRDGEREGELIGVNQSITDNNIWYNVYSRLQLLVAN